MSSNLVQGRRPDGDYPFRPRVRCLCCGAKAAITDSKTITETVRELYFACSDQIGCGHVWAAQLVHCRTIRQSAREDAKILLPVTPFRTRPAEPLQLPTPANDEGLRRRC